MPIMRYLLPALLALAALWTPAAAQPTSKPIQILVQVLNLLDQFVSVDATDDASHAADEMAAAMQPAEPAPARSFTIAEARNLLASHAA